MSSEVLVEIDNVSHTFGSGTLRRQILFDVSEQVHAGEIVLLTGPSGSGKTTLLTLIGALRSAQVGSLRVLGQELRGASDADRTKVRRHIGYIFQAHNLLGALNATENVATALLERSELGRAAGFERARETLSAVGLGEQGKHYPSQLSGGQKQRVAIARALAARPRLILADEPTASLDKKSGRDVVDLMQALAKKEGCAVVLVTHDNRILDIADRIIHLEDGRLAPFGEAVASNTRQLLQTLVNTSRGEDFGAHIKELDGPRFVEMLEGVTIEARRILETIRIANDVGFERMLDQMIEAFTLKVGEILEAERVTLYLVDHERGELWSKFGQGEGEETLEIRVPMGTGIAGDVAQTGKVANIPDAYADPRFLRKFDQQTGFRTKSVLCLPILDQDGRPFAVAQLLNRKDAEHFDTADQRRFEELSRSLGVILESWWHMCADRGVPKRAAGGVE